MTISLQQAEAILADWNQATHGSLFDYVRTNIISQLDAGESDARPATFYTGVDNFVETFADNATGSEYSAVGWAPRAHH